MARPISESRRYAADVTDGTRTLVLLRHGQSEWNLANLFTGWVDVDLSDAGRGGGRRRRSS